jgi:hypothetical protein
MLEREGQSRGPEANVLRTLLEAERAQRMQLEAQLRHPPELLQVLQSRVAQLERLVVGPVLESEAVVASEPEAVESAAEPEDKEPLHEPEDHEPLPEPEEHRPRSEPEDHEPLPEPEDNEPLPEPEEHRPRSEPEDHEPPSEPHAAEPAPEEASASFEQPSAEPRSEPMDAAVAPEDGPSGPAPAVPQTRVRTRERRGLFGSRQRG